MGTNTKVNYKEEKGLYYKVLIGLLLLTAVTFIQPYVFHAGTFTAQMLIAVVKAWLILMYYMHLKGEKLIATMGLFSMFLVSTWRIGARTEWSAGNRLLYPVGSFAQVVHLNVRSGPTICRRRNVWLLKTPSPLPCLQLGGPNPGSVRRENHLSAWDWRARRGLRCDPYYCGSDD